MTNKSLPLSKSALNRAGESLITEPASSQFYELALQQVVVWRDSHRPILQEIRERLVQVSTKIDPAAIVAHRLKRLPSIREKLARLGNSRLARMQDIGGCRAILSDVSQVYATLDSYIATHLTDVRGSTNSFRIIDYIKSPKPSGYRGIHIVLDCRSQDPDDTIQDHKIEIQIRSRVQHAWATSVETVAAFLGQGLKSSLGDDQWLRFFSLASGVFALTENTPPVPATPTEEVELVSELRELWYELQVDTFLDGCRFVVDRLNDYKDSTTFLLVFNSKLREVDITGFIESNEHLAREEYAAAEQFNLTNPEIQVALVTVEDLSQLREAYPNYHADTGTFVANLMSLAIEPYIERYEESGKIDHEAYETTEEDM